MRTTRRGFIRASAMMAAIAAVASAAFGSPDAKSEPVPAKPANQKTLLILGGTSFLGPALIEAAHAKGYAVTTFTRGMRDEVKEGFLPSVEEKLIGNRDPKKDANDKPVEAGKPTDPKVTVGLDALKGRKWDAVIDTSGYTPRTVKASAELLAPNTKHYVFISTISVYGSNRTSGMDENAELAKLPEDEKNSEDVNKHYGALKALCEQECEKAMPGRVTNIRPGFIVGPDDPSDRFTYWPWRVMQGGEVLAPGKPDDPVQVIDVRDLAEWTIHCIDNKVFGTFNATSKTQKWGDVLNAAVKVAPKACTLTWVDAEFLKNNGVGFGQVPIWIPPVDEYTGFHRVSVEKAVKAGLKFRPIETTLKDLITWLPKEFDRREKAIARDQEMRKKRDLPLPKGYADPKKLRQGFSLEAEAAVLQKWKDRDKPQDKSGDKPAETPAEKKDDAPKK